MLPEYSFITTAQLASDSVRLSTILPPSVDAIVGVSRSGLLPASIVATHLHLPIYSVSPSKGLLHLGTGLRIEGNDPDRRPEHVVVIDDTVSRGGAMRRVLPIVERAFAAATIATACVYVHPMGVRIPDYHVEVLPGAHYLEWNWANAIHAEYCGFDFDGILCRDCLPAENDDGPRYREFLRTATPLFLPRRASIPLIVTARHEHYREETREWLARHRITCDRLVMRRFAVQPRDWIAAISEFKADAYREAGLQLFAESEPEQAARIHALTGMPVLCPAAGRVYARNLT